MFSSSTASCPLLRDLQLFVSISLYTIQVFYEFIVIMITLFKQIGLWSSFVITDHEILMQSCIPVHYFSRYGFFLPEYCLFVHLYSLNVLENFLNSFYSFVIVIEFVHKTKPFPSVVHVYFHTNIWCFIWSEWTTSLLWRGFISTKGEWR